MENLNQHNTLIKTLNAQAAKQDIYLICRLQEKRSKGVEAVGQEINEVSTARMKGLGLHLFDKEGHSVLTSTDNIEDKKHLKATLKLTSSSLSAEPKNLLKRSAAADELYNFFPQGRIQPSRTKNPEIFALKPQKDQIDLAKDFYFNALTTPEIEKQLLELNKKIEERGRSIGVGGRLKITTRFNIIQDGWRITRSDGTDVSWEFPRGALFTTLTYEKGRIKVRDHISQASPGWGVLTSTKRRQEFITEISFVINLLRESVDKPEYPAGNYPLLIDANLGGLLAHEAFGHCAESDLIYDRTSVLSKKGKLPKGKKVASPLISIIDETKKNTWGFQPYSAFGGPREKIIIVKNGILQASLGDALSGSKIGDEVRGASRIESYGDIPVPRMSRTFISVEEPQAAIGKFASPEKIQKALLKAGLLKDRLLVLRRSRGGGEVDPHAGTFMFAFAYLYEMTPDSIKLFQGSSFSGKTLGALKAIRAAFGKVDLHGLGWCEKQGQCISNNSGANEFIFIEKTPDVTIGGS